MKSMTTANEKVLREFDKLYIGSSSARIKEFLLKALSDLAEEIAVEIEKYVVVADGEKEVGLKVSAEIARSYVTKGV